MRRKAWNLVLSLRFKLLCAVLALFFTFAGVTTYFWYDRLTRQASDAAANNLHAMLRISNSNFETALKDLNSVTALVSSNFGNGLNTRIFNYLLSGDEDDVTHYEPVQLQIISKQLGRVRSHRQQPFVWADYGQRNFEQPALVRTSYQRER